MIKLTKIEAQLADKKGLLVTGIKPLVNNETSLPVKKELAQTIVTMASSDYLGLEGGETLMEFIIRTSAISEDEISRFAKEREKVYQLLHYNLNCYRKKKKTHLLRL
jgi:hypothetical protein